MLKLIYNKSENHSEVMKCILLNALLYVADM